MRLTKATILTRSASLPFFAFLLLAATLTVGGCNTVSGMGEDISAAGKGIDQTSERTEDKVTGQSHTQERSSGEYKAGSY